MKRSFVSIFLAAPPLKSLTVSVTVVINYEIFITLQRHDINRNVSNVAGRT